MILNFWLNQGQATIADHLKRSYSLNDLSDDMPEPSESNEHMNNDEAGESVRVT